MLSGAAYFNELRRREFGRLDAHDHAYLDYTGSALYGESQIREHHEELQSSLFGNPHSEHAPSRASAEALAGAREELLAFFDVDESTHDVIFTANTTAAIKLVAESYPFGPDRRFVLSADNHNSVNGVREYARRAGAPVTYVGLDADLRLGVRQLAAALSSPEKGLLAFPAQSNFSGVRHPLSLVKQAKETGFDVLLDIAAFAPSHAMSLRNCPADFAALSFYKLFGYPTGLGALIARRDALSRLNRPWFAGGTVMYAAVQIDRHQLRERHEAFEDGTPDFLSVAALKHGFALLREVTMERLSAHVAELTSLFLLELTALRHDNGAPLARIYGPGDMRERGGAVAFNVLDRDGGVIPYTIVESAAREAGVSLRGGCFCNPGASEVAFGLDAQRLEECLDSLGAGFTVERFAKCAGTAVGALRVSVGLANNAADIHRAIAVIAAFSDQPLLAVGVEQMHRVQLDQ